MLSEQQIKKGLHASRVLPIPVASPHGPLGLEHVAQIVAQIQSGNEAHDKKVVPPLEVPLETWLKLEQLAAAATKTAARSVTVSEVAIAILQQYVTTNS